MSQLHASMYEAVISKSGLPLFLSCCFPEEISAVAATKHTNTTRLRTLRIRPPLNCRCLGPTGRVTGFYACQRRKTRASLDRILAAAVRARILPFKLLHVKLLRAQHHRFALPRHRALIPFVGSVSAPFSDSLQNPPQPMLKTQERVHQSPSAPATHCVATYGVSCSTASLRLVRIAVHRRIASNTKTRIITASTAVTTASSRKLNIVR